MSIIDGHFATFRRFNPTVFDRREHAEEIRALLIKEGQGRFGYEVVDFVHSHVTLFLIAVRDPDFNFHGYWSERNDLL